MSNKRYPQELRDRAVRLVLETRDQYPSLNQAIHSIAAKLGIGPESLRNWVRQAEVDAGARPGTTSEESARIRALSVTSESITREGYALTKPIHRFRALLVHADGGREYAYGRAADKLRQARSAGSTSSNVTAQWPPATTDSPDSTR